MTSIHRTLNDLWTSATEEGWKNALDNYDQLIEGRDIDVRWIESYIRRVRAEDIRQLSSIEFYFFLYDKYLFWRYAAKPNRLATTRKALKQYLEKSKWDELAAIQRMLFSMDHTNIEGCIEVALQISGLGINGGATGLLAVLFPEDFGTVDNRTLELLKGIPSLEDELSPISHKEQLTTASDSAILIDIMRKKTKLLNEQFPNLNWTPRKFDMALWTYKK